MAHLLLIKVKDGLKGLRNPLDNLLLEPGKTYEMPASQFWLRRLEQGDVSLVSQEKPKEKLKAKKGE